MGYLNLLHRGLAGWLSGWPGLYTKDFGHLMSVLLTWDLAQSSKVAERERELFFRKKVWVL